MIRHDDINDNDNGSNMSYGKRSICKVTFVKWRLKEFEVVTCAFKILSIFNGFQTLFTTVIYTRSFFDIVSYFALRGIKYSNKKNIDG